MKLQVNQTLDVQLYAKYKWNPTQLYVNKDEEYEFIANGIWKDFLIKTDADGYTNPYMRLFDSMKRVKDQNWFSLIGALDQNSDQFFLIGQHRKITFESEGTIYCFANDVEGFYFNNFGSVTLHIKRIK